MTVRKDENMTQERIELDEDVKKLFDENGGEARLVVVRTGG
jgi:hypothetical protein